MKAHFENEPHFENLFLSNCWLYSLVTETPGVLKLFLGYFFFMLSSKRRFSNPAFPNLGSNLTQLDIENPTKNPFQTFQVYFKRTLIGVAPIIYSNLLKGLNGPSAHWVCCTKDYFRKVHRERLITAWLWSLKFGTSTKKRQQALISKKGQHFAKFRWSNFKKMNSISTLNCLKKNSYNPSLHRWPCLQ